MRGRGERGKEGKEGGKEGGTRKRTYHLARRVIRQSITLVPLAVVQVLLRTTELPDRTEEEEECGVGRRSVNDRRDVRNLDPVRGAGCNVECVVPSAIRGDELDSRLLERRE